MSCILVLPNAYLNILYGRCFIIDLSSTGTRHIFAGIDSTGFKITHASEYYTSRAKLRRKKYAKLSIGANVLKQIICNIKVRRAPTRHDSIYFKLGDNKNIKNKTIIGSCCR